MKHIKLLALLMFMGTALHAADFNDAIFVILKHEGHVSASPSDPGGITSYGLSLRYLTALVRKSPEIEKLLDRGGLKGIDAYDIRHMRVEDAIKVYREYWWDPEGFGALNSQALATKLFDIWVNVGAAEGHQLLFRAYHRTTGNDWRELADINKLSAFKQNQLLSNLKLEQRLFYQELVKRKPAYQPFLKGWVRRANE